MKSPGILEKLDDALNPIVVKELRQGMHSRFFVAALLLFLLAQLLVMGIYLLVFSIGGGLDSSEFQAGRELFGILQGILLTTCVLFIPVYSGFRLAAERPDVHVDLFFISALRPWQIISGKFTAALVLAILIFSACMPFMAFTYFLRGIDLTTIFTVIGLDFLVVTVTVMMALFLAVVPANRVGKVLLGLVGLSLGLLGVYSVIAMTIVVLMEGPGGKFDGRDFWGICLLVVLIALGAIGFLFACSVGLLSPLSANRTLPLRSGVTLWCLGSGLAVAVGSMQIGRTLPMFGWVITVGVLLSLCLLIAVNEREQWAPRVARTIPRRSWLRPWAFLLFSGAAGGVIWACLLFALCGLALPLVVQWMDWTPGRPNDDSGEGVQSVVAVMAVMFGYTYCYSLTAVFVRNTLLRIPPVYTWALVMVLLAMGSGLPFLVTFLLHFGEWSFGTHFHWVLTNPGVGMIVVGWAATLVSQEAEVVCGFVLCWAAVVSVLNGFWFIRQMRRFRAHVGTAGREAAPSILSATPMAATKTSF